MFALSTRRPDQARTFDFARALPKLPVPPLGASLERYVRSLEPVLVQQHAGNVERARAELRQREEWANDFEATLGRRLQERLIDVERSSRDNWLDDNFWVKHVYHSWRAPLPINSNWWILCKDDDGIPADVRQSAPPDGEFTEWQVRRAAKLVHRLVEFKIRLDKQEILPDSSRAGPFCMHQYTRVFGVTRTPALPTDRFVHSPHPHASDYIIVAARDHLYKLPVLASTPPRGSTSLSDVENLPLDELERRLWLIIDDVTARPERGEPVGVCSGAARDDWAAAREHLLALSPDTNRASLSAIEDSLFVLALDDHTATRGDSAPDDGAYESSSTTCDTPDLEMHIRNSSAGANGTGQNRWWDKALSLHVESNGRAGVVGEHSPCDALIPSIVADYALAEPITPPSPAESPSMRRAVASSHGTSFALDKPLAWVLDDQARHNMAAAQATVRALAQDSDARMLWWDEYGADWVKKAGRQSPDAFIQMALQLAWFKDQGAVTPTYETASTRLFRHGRTDVIRTLSTDSYRFVRAMADPSSSSSSSPQERFALLSAATQAHNKYTRDASTGKGCDRHFFGLRLLMRDGESHPLLDDPLFAESQAWRLSTSGLSAGDRFYGTGFGTVWPDGYGINYLAGADVIKFGIESKHSCETTDTRRFRAHLIDALREMRLVCEQGAEQTAKL